MSATEAQRDVVKPPKGTGMFLPLVGRDPKDRDSRPKHPSKKLAAYRPSRPHRNRTASVYMPYQHAQGPLSLQQVPNSSRGASHLLVAGGVPPQVVSHQPPRPSSGLSSSGLSSCSSGASCSAFDTPVAHLGWAVAAGSPPSTGPQLVLQQHHNGAIAMPSQQQHALQGVHAPVQGTTWVVSAAASSTSAGTLAHPAPLQLTVSGAAPACPHPTSTFSSAYSIWGPVAAGQPAEPLMPAHCGPQAVLALGQPQDSSLAGAIPGTSVEGPQLAPQLLPSCQGRTMCAAELMQQQQLVASAGHVIILPAPAAAPQQQQPQQQTPPTSLELQGGLPGGLGAAYPAAHAVKWLAGPAAQPQASHQQEQQLTLQWAGPVSGTAMSGANLPAHHLVLGC